MPLARYILTTDPDTHKAAVGLTQQLPCKYLVFNVPL
ncbi:MAG: hypothetical protein ACI9IT_001000 [Glaciecola sp.]|jgi:hypothetical protein